MADAKLQSLIDRVIGKDGILRVPAYWAHKIFNEIIAYIDNSVKNVKVNVDAEMSDTSENAVSNKTIKKYVDEKVDTINSEIMDNEEVIATALTTLNERIDEIVKKIDKAGL